MTTSIAFPPGFDPDRLIDPLLSIRMNEDGHYRRGITETDPIRFALTYLDHHLSSEDTGGRVSLSEFHLSMAKVARRWMRPEPRRDIWIAPRKAAKSTWQHVILPLWALAHGHRSTFMSFSNSNAQAVRHMANLRKELAENELLLEDFPELRPMRGNGSSNSSSVVMTRGGQVFATGGMDTGALGTKFGSTRIGILTLDDIEPGESNYSPAAKEKRLITLLDDVIPMGERNTVVSLCGTTTMHGSIIHDAVQHAAGRKHAQWIEDEGFKVHHFRPIIDHPDGSRSSMWPAMWSLEYLEERENTRGFAKNYLNDPSAVGDGAHWTAKLFRHEKIPVVRRVLSIDPAVSDKASSDYTAVAVVGTDAASRKFSVDYARQFRISPQALREKVHTLCKQNPDLREVLVEVNQGGSVWAEILSPLPNGARVVEFRVSAAKSVRLDKLLNHYERDRVSHSSVLRELEDQMLAYPSKAAHDDLCDSVANGIEHLVKSP